LSILLEKLPGVHSLTPEDKRRLIDELWSDLARQVEGAGPDTNIVEILEKRFSARALRRKFKRHYSASVNFPNRRLSMLEIPAIVGAKV
jgi:hypothetical protein